MTVAERLHNDALEHLSDARQAMKRLAGCSQDWTAKVLLELEFDNLESCVRQFARCQLGIGAPHIQRTGNNAPKR